MPAVLGTKAFTSRYRPYCPIVRLYLRTIRSPTSSTLDSEEGSTAEES